MTPPPLRFGYKASAEQFAPRELVEFAVEAERVGLDSVWVSDHYQPWRHTGGHAPFSLSWLAAVGERMGGRERVGHPVILPPRTGRISDLALGTAGLRLKTCSSVSRRRIATPASTSWSV